MPQNTNCEAPKEIKCPDCGTLLTIMHTVSEDFLKVKCFSGLQLKMKKGGETTNVPCGFEGFVNVKTGQKYRSKKKG